MGLPGEIAVRKVLFLDVDGVLNCATTTERYGEGEIVGIEPVKAALVNRIQRETGCEIVLSSTWRMAASSRDEVMRHVRFTGATPFHFDELRGEEIQRWLDANPDVARHAILDDDDDFLPGQPLFTTDWRVGLTATVAEAVIEHLNSGEVTTERPGARSAQPVARP